MGLIERDDGWRIPDWLWQKIEPLLPPAPPHALGCHRARIPDRRVMDAILLVLRTGMQWNALRASGICNSSTAHRRFQEWERAGVFHEIWRRGLLDYDAAVGLDWASLAADGALPRHRSAAPTPAPTPPIEPKGGATFASLRGAGSAARAGLRRRQAQRPQTAGADAGLDPHRATRADRAAPAGPLPRCRLSTTPRVASCSPGTGSQRTSAAAARRSSSSSGPPAGAPDAGSLKPATPG